MVKVNVVAVGRVKEKYFSDAIAEYVKRLSKYCEIKLIETPEENYSKVDEGIINVIKEKEAEKILPHLKGQVYAMAIEGRKFSSESFASELEKSISFGTGVFTFVIGGSYGLSDSIKKRADKLISFSEMTFPHTLFRVMLVEQIYRAFSINGGSGYHK